MFQRTPPNKWVVNMMSVIRIASRYANDCITNGNLSSLLVFRKKKQPGRLLMEHKRRKKKYLQNYIPLILVRRNKLGATKLRYLLFQL